MNPKRQFPIRPWNLVLMVSLCLALTAKAQSQAGKVGDPGEVSGVVRAMDAAPVVSAHVYAFSLQEQVRQAPDLRKVLTDTAGKFQFSALPAGIYNVVAFKPGFLPLVVQLSRSAVERMQTLDLVLQPDQTDASEAERYWQLRSSVPGDVLREITTMLAVDGSRDASELVAGLRRFSSGVSAEAGVDNIATAGDAQLSTIRGDFQGTFNELEIGVRGTLSQLQPGSQGGADDLVSASSSQWLIDLKNDSESHLQLTSSSNRLVTGDGGGGRPVDFESVRLDWSRPMGESGQSALSAQLTDESGFYRGGFAEPFGVPESSTTWEVGGTYSAELSDRSTVSTGVKYRERTSRLPYDFGLSGSSSVPRERVDAFGQGGFRVRPSVLIEYGVYTVLSDGDLALAPQGGLVLQVSRSWQVLARASGRFTEDGALDARFNDFLPALHRTDDSACSQGDERCYQLLLARRNGEENSLSLGAVHREFGETLRLYFSEDFFDRQESVYLVPGDRLDELQLALTHRLSSNVLTRIESSFASGGGGTFYASHRDPYENEVRYFITSLDTQFRSTSTGVFVAFHQLEQNLTPQLNGIAELEGLASERLQLKLSQDLNVLLDLPADWALQLNMDLSRGNPAESDKDAIKKRVLGGIAVKF